MSASSDETIFARATAPGRGRAIVRISGPSAWPAVGNLLERALERERGRIESVLPFEGTALPLVLYLMPGPGSYTSEDLIEIHHSGGEVIQALIESRLVERARPAEPGEFTRRAFEGGRIDLAQAEGVMALIRARSEAARRRALSLLQGAAGEELHGLTADLLELCALAEADIDFSDQDIDVLDPAVAAERTRKIREELDRVRHASAQVPEKGSSYRVLLYGPPNAGKSSLLNALAEEERTIVTDTPGTTRDSVAVELTLPGGVIVSLFDSAGIREAGDELEKSGQERSRSELDRTDLVLGVVDGSDASTDSSLFDQLQDRPGIGFVNKADQVEPLVEVNPELFPDAWPVLRGSATTGQGIHALAVAIPERLEPEGGTPARHYEVMVAAGEHLQRAETALREGASPEFAAFDLRVALSRLGEITGKVVLDDILDRIFSTFCIGK